MFWLPGRPEAVPRARHRTTRFLEEWGLSDDLCRTAQLVVSELVTNAVVHTASDLIACVLHRQAGELRITVVDEGDECPAPQVREAGDGDVSGRGLLLVSTLTADWGVEQAAHGRGVWASLTIPQDAEDEADDRTG